MIDPSVKIAAYHALNNSGVLVDSLLLNENAVKSSCGYSMMVEPVVGDRYKTVNNQGVITAVSGKSITIKKDAGYPDLCLLSADTIAINANKPMRVGTYSYRSGEMGGDSPIEKSLQLFKAKFPTR